MLKTTDRRGVFWMLYRLTSLELLRNRFGLILLIIIPVLFLAVVEGTTGQGSLPVKLYFFHSIVPLLLPAFYPCQFIFSALFTGRINAWALLMSFLYTLVFLILLFAVVRHRLKGVYHD